MHPIRKREMGDTTLSYAVGNKGAEFSLAGLPSPHRELLLNWGTAAPEAALPSPSSLRDATSPKVRGLGSPPKIAGHLVLRQTFTAISRDFTGKEL